MEYLVIYTNVVLCLLLYILDALKEIFKTDLIPEDRKLRTFAQVMMSMIFVNHLLSLLFSTKFLGMMYFIMYALIVRDVCMKFKCLSMLQYTV